MKTVFAVLTVLNIVVAAVALMTYIEGGPWSSLVLGGVDSSGRKAMKVEYNPRYARTGLVKDEGGHPRRKVPRDEMARGMVVRVAGAAGVGGSDRARD